MSLLLIMLLPSIVYGIQIILEIHYNIKFKFLKKFVKKCQKFSIFVKIANLLKNWLFCVKNVKFLQIKIIKMLNVTTSSNYKFVNKEN